MFDLRGNDLVLLTLYRTQAIVSPVWPGENVTEFCINDDKRRTKLFSELLENSSNVKQFQALGQLLLIWPQLDALKEQ